MLSVLVSSGRYSKVLEIWKNYNNAENCINRPEEEGDTVPDCYVFPLYMYIAEVELMRECRYNFAN